MVTSAHRTKTQSDKETSDILAEVESLRVKELKVHVIITQCTYINLYYWSVQNIAWDCECNTQH